MPLPEITYRSTIEISEHLLSQIVDKKLGDKIRFMASYEVIEKTKNYVMLRINFTFAQESKRLI